MTTSDGDKLRVLTTRRHELEAGLVVAALEQSGLRARLAGELTAGFRVEAPGRVQVLVQERDLPQARQILAELDAGDAEIDWSQVDVGDRHPPVEGE